MKSTLFLLLLSCLLTPSINPQGQAETGLFPRPAGHKTGYLPVSDRHRIFYVICGNPRGIPVMCIHGGPGTGSYPRLTRYFDPTKYFIILHDQRGAGQSRPHGELQDNTTSHLVGDMEKLRQHLKLDKVLLFGGSWGTTLSLAYAQAHPGRVGGMILRGIFLATPEEVAFHYTTTANFFPREHAALLRALPDPKRASDPGYLYKLAMAPYPQVRNKVLRALAAFELKFMRLHMPTAKVDGYLGKEISDEHLRTARLDLHYVTKGHFLAPGQLLRDCKKIKSIPTTLIHGRYDMATPLRSAYRLHRALPQSKLIIVEEAGHSEGEPGITRALLQATKDFADQAQKKTAKAPTAGLTISHFAVGGNLFKPTLKSRVKIQDPRAHTLVILARQGKAGEKKLQTYPCKKGDTIQVAVKFQRLTTKWLEFRLLDQAGSVSAQEKRKP